MRVAGEDPPCCAAYIYGTNAWIAAYPTTPAVETSYNYVNKSQLSASKTAKPPWNKGEGAGSSSPVMLVISSHEYSACTYFTLEPTCVAWFSILNHSRSTHTG